MYRGLTVLIMIFALLLIAPGNFSVPELPEASEGYVGPSITSDSYLFVGDVMLARYVEELSEREGNDYFFAGTDNLFRHYDHVIGNFEGPITLEHTPTEPDAMLFSVASSTVRGFEERFTHFSLANNHTWDHQEESFLNTQNNLSALGLSVFGEPNNVASSTLESIIKEDYSLELYGFNFVSGISATSAAAVLAQNESTEAIQVVYVHWGEEYQDVHSDEQQRIAETLIDAGADVIIGHHPHIVQDIGLYKGVPIFYSLGNFIFDQYFSEEVQTHLAVGLVIENNEVSFQLIPLTSLGHETQPRFMTVDAKNDFLKKLAERSDEKLHSAILRGKIVVSEVLASL